jgi:DNA-binding response OmpR family regulator
MSEPRSTARILVGDDEIQICRLVRDVLRPSGYDVDVTQDGRALLEKYHSGDYSLLILDTLMVQASGLEVVMRLRDRGDVVPIILMIGPRKEPDQVETFAFTYRVDILRKPFGVGELRDTVARALRLSRPD